jgi:ATP-dependent helicase HrpB
MTSLPGAPLPVDAVLPRLLDAMAAGPAVLVAPPGAGKTTRVPLALLAAPWLGTARIVMLEPRRLAARAAARHMARTLGEEVGGTIGHRVRMDTRVSRRTRVEVVTEGVLTRMLQDDPALDGIGVLIFDEFHERSVHADLGLALALEARALLRPDLRLLAMSATLDAAPVAALLGDAPVLASQGRLHEVQTVYLRDRLRTHIEPAAVRTVLAALERHPGDALVFLPGARELRLAATLLREAPLPPAVELHVLHGSLPADAQDRALAPAAPGVRRIVLATAIAETSLTIEGVRIVVDSGLARVPRFSPRAGMSRLATVRVSRASADQRRGRAGRTAPGFCYRLWTEAEDASLPARATPEILEADLAPLVLELAAWGVREPGELRWLDPPPAGATAQARELLAGLGALDADGRITNHGRELARIGAHPRIAHMLLEGRRLGALAAACSLAAILDERDLLHGEGGPPDADVRLRMELLEARGSPARWRGFGVHGAGLHHARAAARQWRQRLGGGPAAARVGDVDDAGALVALAYPDRVAQRRDGGPGRFLLRNGRGAQLDPAQPLAASDLLAVADVEGGIGDGRILLAAPLEERLLRELFHAQIRTDEEVVWDDEAKAVRGRRVERLGALVLHEVPARPATDAALALILATLRERGLGMLHWSDDAIRVLQRLAFLHGIDATWPDVGDEALLASLESWLAPRLDASARRDVLAAVALGDALHGLVGPGRRQRFDALAPTHWEVPSGSRIPIRYDDPAAPVLAVRLQEMFGLRETPRIAGGRVPLTLHLLSPAQRPVQVTRDLASFWAEGYFQVRKDLRGRYPRHSWPDDPLRAEPTRRARRRD